MVSESLYLCNRCKKRYNIDNVKFDRWGKLVCVKCLGEIEPAERRKLERPEIVLNFICVNCRFKFRIKKGSPRKIFCPYCGRTNIMQVKKYKDEDDLIKESSDPRYDY